MKRTQLVLGGKKPAKLTLRLSEADAELIRQAADEARQSLNLWCREALVLTAKSQLWDAAKKRNAQARREGSLALGCGGEKGSEITWI